MPDPTPAELEILQILWARGEATAQDVNDALQQTRPVSYTGTLKQLQLMHDKGLVSRYKSGRSHTYQPAIAESSTKTSLLERFMHTTFGGSARALLLQLVESKSVSATERKAIRDYLKHTEDKT